MPKIRTCYMNIFRLKIQKVKNASKIFDVLLKKRVSIHFILIGRETDLLLAAPILDVPTNLPHLVGTRAKTSVNRKANKN